MQQLLARIRRYDPQRGFTLKRYSFRGILFHEGKGWYAVTPEIAKHLETVVQQPHNPHSPPAFEILSKEEAEKLEKKEKEDARAASAAQSPRPTEARDESDDKPKRSRGSKDKDE